MKALITRFEEFKAKSGVDYVKLSYVMSDGSIGYVMTEKKRYDSFGIDIEKYVMQKETLAGIMSDSKLVDISFDQRGYLVGIK